MVAALGLMTLAQVRGEDVRLLAGFEWDEWQARLGRFQYLGTPNLTPPGPGWKGEKLAGPEAVGPQGFQVINGEPSSSRHMPDSLMVAEHATQGTFAFKFLPQYREMGSWASLARYLSGKTAMPFAGDLAGEPGYDPRDWYLQRFCRVWRQEWAAGTDWSGFERLRFDVRSVGAPLILGVRLRDATGPRINAGPTGIRTALATFRLPADQTVTCDFPLAEMARVAELDLSKVHRYHIRINGLVDGRAPTDLFLDNIRLTAKGGGGAGETAARGDGWRGAAVRAAGAGETAHRAERGGAHAADRARGTARPGDHRGGALRRIHKRLRPFRRERGDVLPVAAARGGGV